MVCSIGATVFIYILYYYSNYILDSKRWIYGGLHEQSTPSRSCGVTSRQLFQVWMFDATLAVETEVTVIGLSFDIVDVDGALSCKQCRYWKTSVEVEGGFRGILRSFGKSTLEIKLSVVYLLFDAH